MTSDRALRVCMQALVLSNLVFVQLTEAAGLVWLLPLYALALAAPLLAVYRERRAYQYAWNSSVICVFVLLLRHALHADLAYVLQDGLVLAALCQVHLLNNLRSDQRPDLLFFNAFLIAFITGVLTRGLGFAAAFLLFAPCFVIGLQLLSAMRAGRVLSARSTRRLALDGARRSALLIGLTLLAFFFWPRDFGRRAYFSGTFDESLSDRARLELGFNEHLALDRSRAVETKSRPALRVTLLDGERSAVPSLWRGATLGATRDGEWRALDCNRRHDHTADDVGWRVADGRLVRSTGLTFDLLESLGALTGTRVEVVRYDQDTRRLFAPLESRVLELAGEHARLRATARSDGTVDVDSTGRVRYEVTLFPAPASSATTLGGAPLAPVPKGLLHYVDLPETEHVRRARELARELTRKLPAGTEQRRIVALLSEHLAARYPYVAPGTEGAARSLDEFLRTDAGGHCEFFASALATMLRSLRIPCRVVTGFRGANWDARGRSLTIGTADAHAWVEVADPRGGWYAVDPSPVLGSEIAGTSLLARLRSSAHRAWLTVTQFDAERRAAVLAWARSLVARAEHEAAKWLLLFLVLAGWLALGARRRRARARPEVRAYRRALRRAKVTLLVGETPRELLSRARRLGLPAPRLDALEQATREHEAARYSARPDPASRPHDRGVNPPRQLRSESAPRTRRSRELRA